MGNSGIRSIALLYFALLLLVPDAHGIEEWTHDRGDPGNRRATPDPQIRPPFRTKWIGGPPQYSGGGMVSAGGALYLFSGRGKILALDAGTGKQRWEVMVPGLFGTGENETAQRTVAAPGRLYVLTTKGCVGLDAKTGKTLKTYLAPANAGMWT